MDWFHHEPGLGRVGPLSADELRARYRDRRIQRDTLVWREGLREWQPLERMADELDLGSVRPDASQPPPLPPVVAPGAPATHVRTPVRPEPQRMSGCLIALIAGVAVAVPTIAILAAIAVPAYDDYVVRSKVVAAVDVPAAQLKPAVLEARERLGRCAESIDELGIPPSGLPEVELGAVADGRCAFVVTVRGAKPKVDGKTVLYIAPDASDGRWDCSGGDLPPKYRSPACRASTDTGTDE